MTNNFKIKNFGHSQKLMHFYIKSIHLWPITSRYTCQQPCVSAVSHEQLQFISSSSDQGQLFTLSSISLYNLAISAAHFSFSASVNWTTGRLLRAAVGAGFSLLTALSRSRTSALAFSLSNCSSAGTRSPVREKRDDHLCVYVIQNVWIPPHQQHFSIFYFKNLPHIFALVKIIISDLGNGGN